MSDDHKKFIEMALLIAMDENEKLKQQLQEAIELLKFIESRNCPSGINKRVYDFLEQIKNNK